LLFAVETFFIPGALGRASSVLRVAVLRAAKLAASGVAGASFRAGLTACGAALLLSAQPARAWEKVMKNGKRNTAFRMERETREYVTKCSLKKIGMSQV
jgi:predicted phage tail protein